MRLTHLWIALFFCGNIYTQSVTNVEESIDLALKNSIEVNIKDSNLKESVSSLDEVSRLANPSISYEREDLSYNQVEEYEWMVTGSLPLNFLWNRWSKISSKESLVEAQKLLLDHQKLVTELDVRREFYSVVKYSELSSQLKKVEINLLDLYKTSKVRYKNGDISSYELKRLLIELNSLKSTIADVELSRQEYENKLRLLTNSEVSENVQSTVSLSNLVDRTFVPINISSIQDDRADYKAMLKLLKSEEENLGYQKLNSLPELSITAGYKESSSQFKGSVVGIEMEVPLFERNQKGIETSHIQVDLLKRQMKLLSHKIILENEESLSRLNKSITTYKDLLEIDLKEILEISKSSYMEGEISLIEFIDGIKTSVEGYLFKTETEIKLYNSYLDYNKSIGKSLLSMSNMEYNK